MQKSERPTQDCPTTSRWTLDHAPLGLPVVVLSIAPFAEVDLTSEGLLPGSELVAERRLPLGGPLVLQIGHARLALARALARGIDVGPAGKAKGTTATAAAVAKR